MTQEIAGNFAKKEENPGIFIRIYYFSEVKIAKPFLLFFFKYKTKPFCNKNNFNNFQNRYLLNCISWGGRSKYQKSLI